MRNILTAARAALVGLLVVAPVTVEASARAPVDRLRVVATVPDLADVVREVGGERVDVTTLMQGPENVHRVAVRPSHLVAMGRADLYVQMGLGLEHAFAPGLLKAARNRAILPGGPGFVDASIGWEPIEVPTEVTRRDGADVHPAGNPHWNLAPTAGRHMAERVLAGLVAVDPTGADHYRARHAAFTERLAEAEERWERMGERLAGRKLVTYHREFSYLARAHGIVVVGEVEPRPGVPPTPGHLAALVRTMEAEEVPAIATARWSNDKSVRFLSERTGAVVIELPTFVNGTRRADSWIAMLDELHERLVDAIAPKEKPRGFAAEASSGG